MYTKVTFIEDCNKKKQTVFTKPICYIALSSSVFSLDNQSLWRWNYYKYFLFILKYTHFFYGEITLSCQVYKCQNMIL